MLAVAYVLRLGDLRREVDALNLASSVSMALGGGGEHLRWGEIKAEFDADLAADPQNRPSGAEVDSGRGIRLRALGFHQ